MRAQAICQHPPTVWRMDLHACGLCGITAEQLHRRTGRVLPAAEQRSYRVTTLAELSKPPAWAAHATERLLHLAPPSFWRAVLRGAALAGLEML